jgi:phage shock protein C
VNSTTHTTRRLYRCREDRQIAGVAGGIAEYLEIDPTVVRILWILSFFLGGFGLLLYVIMAFVVPLEPAGYDLPTGFGTGGPAAGTGTGSAAGGTVAGASFSESTGESSDPAAEPEPGATGQTGATGQPGASPAGAAPVHGHGWAQAPANATGHHGRRARSERGGGIAMAFGVLLVVFGLIALLGPIFPGWLSGVSLGPAFLVALGVALLVGALRRPAGDR